MRGERHTRAGHSSRANGARDISDRHGCGIFLRAQRPTTRHHRDERAPVPEERYPPDELTVRPRPNEVVPRKSLRPCTPSTCWRPAPRIAICAVRAATPNQKNREGDGRPDNRAGSLSPHVSTTRNRTLAFRKD